MIDGELTQNGSVTINGPEVAGLLELFGGTASGSTVSGGTVTSTGIVWLAEMPQHVFAGTATFAAVAQTGNVVTIRANASGTINVTGDVAGLVATGGGHLLSAGKILVGGNVTSTGFIDVYKDGGGYGGNMQGKIEVAGDLAGVLRVSLAQSGNIQIGGDVAGDGLSTGVIHVGTNVSGDVEIGGDLTGAIDVLCELNGNGRILIDGSCNGEITIAQQTTSQTLIRATDGLGSSGSITVNDGEGNYDAYGAIHIGPATGPYQGLASITFDGSIMIQDGTSGGGDLEGTITVVGCHATDDDLDICICGGSGGENVSIIQTDCENQVDWSCISGCE